MQRSRVCRKQNGGPRARHPGQLAAQYAVPVLVFIHFQSQSEPGLVQDADVQEGPVAARVLRYILDAAIDLDMALLVKGKPGLFENEI